MPTALVTGASSGIGAVYARRFAARGYDLVLVARATDRLNALAAELQAAHGVAVEVITADLIEPAQLDRVVRRLRSGSPVDLLVNNAGTALPGGFVGADPAAMDKLLRLNVQVPTLLASAAVGGMLERGHGAIINIASVVALIPEYFPGIYAATKSYMMTFSRGLAAELGPKGIYVQAVLPAATRTEIWAHAGADVEQIPGLMEVDDLVDAALVGFDRKEEVTIPPVPEASAWEAFEQARGGLAAGFGNSRPAARYLA
ncbi:MAG TPA: SDR family oxidoreductase [Ancylobacter sp.]